MPVYFVAEISYRVSMLISMLAPTCPAQSSCASDVNTMNSPLAPELPVRTPSWTAN